MNQASGNGCLIGRAEHESSCKGEVVWILKSISKTE